jgi:hypothetical protein
MVRKAVDSRDASKTPCGLAIILCLLKKALMLGNNIMINC